MIIIIIMLLMGVGVYGLISLFLSAATYSSTAKASAEVYEIMNEHKCKEYYKELEFFKHADLEVFYCDIKEKLNDYAEVIAKKQIQPSKDYSIITIILVLPLSVAFALITKNTQGGKAFVITYAVLLFPVLLIRYIYFKQRLKTLKNQIIDEECKKHNIIRPKSY